MRLDEDADLMFDSDEKYILVIVGGGALILQGYLTRATRDIDAIRVSPELRGLMQKYDINSNVKAYETYMPLNFEDRLVKLFDGKKIEFYTASLEDLVIAKLHSNLPRHRQDIIDDTVIKALDWELLEHLAKDKDEVYANELNDNDYYNFLSYYEEYIGRFRP
jgi:proline dehydrogenase